MAGNGSIIESKIDVIDGYHDVPGIDAIANAVIRDALGNKTDTVAGTSAIALVKQLIAALLVPVQDSVDNIVLRDALGNKTDTVAGTSVIALIKQLIAALETVDGYTEKIDNLASLGLAGVSNSLTYRVHEIERHFHNNEYWYGAAAVSNGEIHVADEVGPSISPFALLAG
ncbi:unnamed protein product, partial [marine sediment metagenome]